MNRFIQAFANLFRIEDLRNRLFFTLGLLAVYRLGAHIPTPGINTAVLEEIFKQSAGSVLGIFDLFSGGNFRRLTIFALGIMPYITASIILQLMTVAWPYLSACKKKASSAAARSRSTRATSPSSSASFSPPRSPPRSRAPATAANRWSSIPVSASS